ncbi:MAG: hypothetical protein EOT05_01670 [Candidatus Microsaccharimonas sossegonensis]|uniref:Uncharacterized protein n=1 Tax=Candidatus Microsaccharimonas sossegonensis TaxID=2506948 RepID=A0A4Q0AHK6_9BACT|nr:MAG: hypothetical protein EOT05_01670 [Candidatus Microsaccharimonas sossegonensis]
MEQIPTQAAAKKKKSSKFLCIAPWVGSALFVAVLAIGAYFYVTKKPIVVVPAGNTTSVSTIVCDDAIVNTYNAASKLQVRTPGGDVTTDVDALTRLDATIRSKTGFEQDPTCQTILFWNAITSSDVGKATIALKAIQSLHDAHNYADSNLENTTSISVMKDSLTALSTNKV